MARPPVIIFVALFHLLWAGCNSLPVFYAPPAQRASQASRHLVKMGDPDANSYIVQGFRSESEGGAWRWALDHPVLRFTLPDAGPLQFTMLFTLPQATFHDTGPVTLSVAINGKPFDRIPCDHAGDYQVTRPVADSFLHKPGVNLVAIDPSKTATPEKLGFVLTSAGFAE